MGADIARLSQHRLVALPAQLRDAIRDTELLEQSLLKTVAAVLGMNDVSRHKTDGYPRCMGVPNHHHTLVLDRECVERVTERIETDYQNVEVPAPEPALMENVRLTHKPSAWQIDGSQRDQPAGLYNRHVLEAWWPTVSAKTTWSTAATAAATAAARRFWPSSARHRRTVLGAGNHRACRSHNRPCDPPRW